MNKDKKNIKSEELNQVNGGIGTLLENGDIVCGLCGKTFSKNNCEIRKVGAGCFKHDVYVCPHPDCGGYNDLQD